MKYVKNLLNSKILENEYLKEFYLEEGDTENYAICIKVISEIQLVLDMLAVDKIYSDL